MSDQSMTKTAGATGIGGSGSAPAPAPAPPQQAAPARFKAALNSRKWLLLAALAVVGVAAYLGWKWLQPAKLPDGFASSNGRIEATEVDIATKLAQRIKDELVDEGDFVTAGQVVAHMDIESLQAQRREAVAKLAMAKSAVDTARSTLAQRESEKAAAESVVAQRDAEFPLATRKYARGQRLVRTGSMSQEEFDTERSAFYSAKAAVSTCTPVAMAVGEAYSSGRWLYPWRHGMKIIPIGQIWAMNSES